MEASRPSCTWEDDAVLAIRPVCRHKRLLAMPIVHAPTGFPISAKGVVLCRGRALLLRNARGEWDLPGGRPEPGEDLARTVEREVMEESGARVTAEHLIDEWDFAVLPQRFVWIVAWGCRLQGMVDLKHSHEHEALAWFTLDRLDRIALPLGYARAVRLWARRAG